MQWLYRLADLARHRARVRLWTPDRASGRRGEDLAHRFLRRLGFSVVARNYRSHAGSGEIDLIAWDGDTLVFAEVKSLATDEFSAPDRAIGLDQQQSLIRAAGDYLHRAGLAWDRVRFDVLNVILSDPPRLTLRKGAFRPQGRAAPRPPASS